ncbi:MAG TPA: alkaline phosphatase family protein [Thermoanaerobaculia bacterium]|nr:alkaline phosphatase family protein [Thermoanaerobaculia bacterium]
MLGPSPPAVAPRLRLPPALVVAAAAALPGLLVGIHVGGLIFFLNPELRFGAVPLLRGAAVYGGLGGLAGALLSLPWLWGREARARRWLPWGLTAALAVAALLDWGQAAHYSYFLPPGINRRLIKAALFLSLAALIAFYTALLHGLARRRYGRRSRLGFVLLALVSVYVMVERRDAFQPGPPASPRPSAVEDQQRPTLLVVGIEGSTLDAVLPLASQGRLPFLASVVEGGAYGRLTSLAPNRRLPLWTTLATGKFPYKHGLVSDRRFPLPFLGPDAELRLLPAGIGFTTWGTLGESPRPVDARHRQALPLWEVLPRLGVGAGVIGWPGTFPSPEGPTFAISDRYFADPSTPGAARPAQVAARARLFRVPPDEVDPLLLASFGDSVPREVQRALARDLWRESLASFLLLQHRDVGALFIELDGLATPSLADLGGYAAVQFEAVREPAYQQAARRIAAYYAHLDLFLSRLWDRMPPPKLLAVVSPYGAAPPDGWRRAWVELAPGPALEGTFEGSPDGLLLLYGQGIAPGTLLTGARLVDVVPTLAYGAGFPIARDLDGRVLTNAFDRGFLAGHPLTFLPSYETLEEREAGAAEP